MESLGHSLSHESLAPTSSSLDPLLIDAVFIGRVYMFANGLSAMFD